MPDADCCRSSMMGSCACFLAKHNLAYAVLGQMILLGEGLHRLSGTMKPADLLVSPADRLTGAIDFPPAFARFFFLRDIDKFTGDVLLQLFQQACRQNLPSVPVTDGVSPPMKTRTLTSGTIQMASHQQISS